MADIRIKVAKDKAKLVKALRAGEGSTGPFQTYADVVTFAAAFGFSKKKRVPFEQASRRDPDPIPGDQFKNRGLMDLIAIAETQNPNILSSSDEQVQEKACIFEEYANGGFELLEHQMNGAGDIADPRRARYDQSRGNAEQRYTIVFPAGGHNESLFT